MGVYKYIYLSMYLLDYLPKTSTLKKRFTVCLHAAECAWMGVTWRCMPRCQVPDRPAHQRLQRRRHRRRAALQAGREQGRVGAAVAGGQGPGAAGPRVCGHVGGAGGGRGDAAVRGGKPWAHPSRNSLMITTCLLLSPQCMPRLLIRIHWLILLLLMHVSICAPTEILHTRDLGSGTSNAPIGRDCCRV